MHLVEIKNGRIGDRREAALPHDGKITDILPPGRDRLFDVAELWGSRHILAALVTRDLKVRYKQTAVGVVWALLQPLASMLVFTLLFSVLTKVPSEGVPYPIFVLAALIPWQCFTRVVGEGGQSLVSNAALLTKIYFPRWVLVLVPAVTAFIDLLISMLVLMLLMLAFGVFPGASFLAFPAFALLAFMIGLGLALWLSALNAIYRDIRLVLPFVLQLWMFVTPVVYPISFVPEHLRMLFYVLNPLAPAIEGYRWAVVGAGGPPEAVPLLISCVVAVSVFVSGIWFFRRLEAALIDRI
jgi:lipopolysaccharide transport system permease protein